MDNTPSLYCNRIFITLLYTLILIFLIAGRTRRIYCTSHFTDTRVGYRRARTPIPEFAVLAASPPRHNCAAILADVCESVCGGGNPVAAV